MNYNNGDIVLFNNNKYVLRIANNAVSGNAEYFLYTLDGKLFASNFSLDLIKPLNSTVETPQVRSSGSKQSSGGSGGGNSGGGRSSNLKATSSDKDVDASEASKDSTSSKKLSDSIGTLLKTEKTMADCKDIISKAKDAVNTANITVDTWDKAQNAQGLATEASIVYLNNLADCLDSVINNLESTSAAANSLHNLNENLKVLLIKFSEKKEKEDNKKAKETELLNTDKQIQSGTNSNGEPIMVDNPRIKELEKEIEELRKEIVKLEEQIEILQNVIDAQYKNIKANYSELSNLGTFSNGISFEASSGNIFGTSGSVSDEYKLMLVDVGDKMNLYTYNGDEFLICNTAISLDDYVEYINKNRLYQNKGFMGSRCLELASIYAEDMISGTYTTPDAFKNSGIYNRIDSVRSQSEDEILEYVYSEVSQGRPVGLQVSQMRGDGYRHFVTVVGFKKGVSSAKDLTPENMLVLDDVDGRVQTLDERNRTLARHGNDRSFGVNLSTVA